MKKLYLLLLAVALITGAAPEVSARKGGWVRGYTRKDGTHVSGHYRRGTGSSSTRSSSRRSGIQSSPVGAAVECMDGTYSRSTGSGTCSHHGGIRRYLSAEEAAGIEIGVTPTQPTYGDMPTGTGPYVPRRSGHTIPVETDELYEQERQRILKSDEANGFNADTPPSTSRPPAPTTSTSARSTPATSTTLQGKVIGVADGDTVTLLINRQQVKVHLYGIDCPEKGQPFSERAKQFTSVMTFDKTATVYAKGTDRYGRTLGWLFVGDVCVNRELISNGLAWWYQEFARHEIKLDDLEQKARAAKVGLWSEHEPIAPWEWRRAKPVGPNVSAE